MKKTDVTIKYTDEQLAQIDKESGRVERPTTPIIKFNAKEEEGRFYITTGKKNEKGSAEYEEIEKDKISIHIISCNNKKISSGLEWKKTGNEEVSSGEVNQFAETVDLKDPQGNTVAVGSLKELRKQHPEWKLNFQRVLYTFYEGKPFKFYLSGGKSIKF